MFPHFLNVKFSDNNIDCYINVHLKYVFVGLPLCQEVWNIINIINNVVVSKLTGFVCKLKPIFKETNFGKSSEQNFICFIVDAKMELCQTSHTSEFLLLSHFIQTLTFHPPGLFSRLWARVKAIKPGLISCWAPLCPPPQVHGRSEGPESAKSVWSCQQPSEKVWTLSLCSTFIFIMNNACWYMLIPIDAINLKKPLLGHIWRIYYSMHCTEHVECIREKYCSWH